MTDGTTEPLTTFTNVPSLNIHQRCITNTIQPPTQTLNTATLAFTLIQHVPMWTHWYVIQHVSMWTHWYASCLLKATVFVYSHVSHNICGSFSSLSLPTWSSPEPWHFPVQCLPYSMCSWSISITLLWMLLLLLRKQQPVKQARFSAYSLTYRPLVSTTMLGQFQSGVKTILFRLAYRTWLGAFVTV